MIPNIPHPETGKIMEKIKMLAGYQRIGADVTS